MRNISQPNITDKQQTFLPGILFFIRALFLLFTTISLSIYAHASAPKNYLNAEYTETFGELTHGFTPWSKKIYSGNTQIYFGESLYLSSNLKDKKYLQQLAGFPHTLEPDALENTPKKPQFIVEDNSTLKDDQGYTLQRLRIYDITHTQSYFVYYFPEEKLLYEGDLVWMTHTKENLTNTLTTERLLQTIKNANIRVERIIQSWPQNNKKFIADFSLDDLLQ